jgi:metal-responsive CopG/Arc/MetJ family transcriptional regulator
MATELINFKMDSKLLKEVDSTFREAGFHSRTEFIRQALRREIDEVKLKKAMKEFAHIKGSVKKKINEEQLEKIREKVSQEFDSRFR